MAASVLPLMPLSAAGVGAALWVTTTRLAVKVPTASVAPTVGRKDAARVDPVKETRTFWDGTEAVSKTSGPETLETPDARSLLRSSGGGVIVGASVIETCEADEGSSVSSFGVCFCPSFCSSPCPSNTCVWLR